LLLVTRQSPDWQSLARDFRAVGQVDPARFCPDAPIPGFPTNLVDLVNRWNTEMAIDFFTCRAYMKDISDQTIAQLPTARRTTHDQVAQIGPHLGQHDLGRYIVFFHDDDDWFSPQTADIIAQLPMNAHDVCVFPLVRLWTDTCTFVRREMAPRAVLGRKSDFVYRYMSNNYGITGRICDAEMLVGMKDHILASDFANQRGLRDIYMDEIVSATAKTPCSASMLPYVFADNPHAHVRRYVAALRALIIPPTLGWMSLYVQRVIALFSAVT
jgi:hypothetical protein